MPTPTTNTFQVPAGQTAALLAAASAAGITLTSVTEAPAPKGTIQGHAVAPEGCHFITDDRGLNRLSRMTQDEYNNWKNQTRTTSYADLKIVPKRDFGQHGYYDSKTRTNLREGWVVVYERGPFKGCNAMPGGTWSWTHEGAMNMIHAFIAAGGDTVPERCEDNDPKMAQRFHALVRLTKRDD